MADRVRLDYNAMLAPRLGGRGIDPALLDEAAERFREIHQDVERRRRDGQLAFFDLPYDTEGIGQIRQFAEGAGQAFDTVVVLGIGGSALGTIALQQALNPPYWNELDGEGRDYYPRLYVLDNIDPTTIGPLFDRIDPRRALFNVVSKSGTTAETVAQFLVARDLLIQELGDDGYRRHVIVTTDPERGALREIAEREGLAALPIPPGVGGRFSVLSAVGLLPASLVGIDIEALAAGARDMDERCRTDRLSGNPAGLFAALQYLADTRAGAPIHVMMAYSDRLYGVADWFRQLWAESLGKRLAVDGREVFSGPTPVKALGVTDQHSQIQLYMEGPYDKTVCFLTAARLDPDLRIPGGYPDLGALGYLGGHTLGELLDAERRATASALTRHGRMNMTIELPRIGPYEIGQLLMMLQIATVYAGAFYGVDPLDQPGVELGKRLTYGLMGRPGYEAPQDPPPDPRWICD